MIIYPTDSGHDPPSVPGSSTQTHQSALDLKYPFAKKIPATKTDTNTHSVLANLRGWDSCCKEIKIRILELAIAEENSRSKFNVLGFKLIKSRPDQLHDIIKKDGITIFAKTDAYKASPFLSLNHLARKLYLKTQIVAFQDPGRGWKMYQTRDLDLLMLRYPSKLEEVTAGPSNDIKRLVLNSDDLRAPSYNINFSRIKQMFPNLQEIAVINSSHSDSAELLDNHLDSPLELRVVKWIADMWSSNDAQGVSISDKVLEQVNDWIVRENVQLEDSELDFVTANAPRPPASRMFPAVEMVYLARG